MVKHAFNKKLLEFAYLLSHSKKLLQPKEMTEMLNSQGNNVTERTVRRWLNSLRRHGFQYYPYPRYESFGLNLVILTAWNVKNNALLSILPYRSYIAEGFEFNNNSKCNIIFYTIPDGHLSSFKTFWEQAKKSKLIDNYDIHMPNASVNIYSPLHKILDNDGNFVDADFEHGEHPFELLEKSMKKEYSASIHPHIKKNPILLPLAFEMNRNFNSISNLSRSLRKNLGKSAVHYNPTGITSGKIKEGLHSFEQNFDELFQQMKIIYDPLYSGENITLHLMLDLKPNVNLSELTRKISKYAVKTIVYPSRDNSRHAVFYILTNQKNITRIFMNVISDSIKLDGHNHYIWQSYEESKNKFWKTQDDLRFKYHEHFDPKNMSWKYDHSSYMSALRSLNLPNKLQ
ncbi:MAG: hypothetical protein HY362_04420 [Candidatus Aenigmarchaeota archaeon]|nr:hypothetical protein [Candidatus Aenigmarchaeota archaeon]